MESAFTFTNDIIVAFFDGQTYQVNKEHPNFVELKIAAREKDFQKFKQLYLARDMVAKAFIANKDNRVTYSDGAVYYNGHQLNNLLTERIAQIAKEGYSFDPLIKFLENLMQNPSSNSVEELYKFLEHKNLPITDDGCFLAYKSVRSNYYDKYTGKILNSIGSVISVPRNTVDDNKNVHCSHGLHVGALSYAGPGGWYNNSDDRVVIVKVNPKNAVSVPTDNSFTKLRVCEYTVLCDYNEPLGRSCYSSTGENLHCEENHEDEPIYYVGPDELIVGDIINFDYINKNGVFSHKDNVTIETIDYANDKLYCDTIEGTRVFIMRRMSKIVIQDNYDNYE